MPLKTGSYTMVFMVDTGVLPFPVYYDASMNIEPPDTPSSLTGTITVPKLEVYDAQFEGQQADSQDGITTTFTFATTDSATKLDAYGMTISCGGELKVMGGANVTKPTGLPGDDPTQDACWLATHSGAGAGDGDEDDLRAKKKYSS